MSDQSPPGSSDGPGPPPRPTDLREAITTPVGASVALGCLVVLAYSFLIARQLLAGVLVVLLVLAAYVLVRLVRAVEAVAVELGRLADANAREAREAREAGRVDGARREPGSDADADADRTPRDGRAVGPASWRAGADRRAREREEEGEGEGQPERERERERERE